MRKTNKKGFTIVELVIVIAVVAILAAVLVPTFVSVVKKANESKDTQLVRNLNTALAVDTEVGKHETMQSALEAAAKAGYDVAKINTSATDNEILWDSKNDCFVYKKDSGIEYIPNSVSEEQQKAVKNYQYWIIASAPDATYSTYLYDYKGSGTETVTTGLDVGNETVAAITYKNDTANAQEVVIRTNSASTSLKIDDASTGAIYHYGSAGALNIIQCHTASYHEKGKVAFAEIAKGRIVLENDSEIKHIHVNANNSVFDSVIISDNGAKTLPSAITRDQVNVSQKTLVVTVESNGSTEKVYVSETGSTQKVTEGENKQNENVNSSLGQLALDNGEGSKSLSSDAKEDTKKQIVDTAVYQETINNVSTKWTGETVELVTTTRNWLKETNGKKGYVLPYGTSNGPGLGDNKVAESDDEFNQYYNNAVAFVTMVDTTLNMNFYLDVDNKHIHVSGPNCLQYLYLLDDYLSAKNQIDCKDTKYPYGVYYNAETSWEIKVDNDIDLGGKIENGKIINAWTPVNSQLTVDFQGHKVTNLVTDKYITTDGTTTNSGDGASGLFGFTKSTIKNLVLENVTIFNLSGSTTSYAGAIAGNIAGNIENCKVINANITSSKYVGSIAGMGYGSIKNCTIENSVITGGYKLGGLIGQSSNSGGNFYYTDNTLNNVTIQINKGIADKKEYVVGKIIGYLQNNTDITGNTLLLVSIKESSGSDYIDLTNSIEIHTGKSDSNKAYDENGYVGIYETKYTVNF
ncbi:MAG: type II secretion system protein [Firmicutes bacterium]|nr:type II secretion system protein [Bacillota bacterium]